MSREKRWENLRHILIQEDEEYMSSINEDKKTSNNKIVNNFMKKGFDRYETFIKNLLYLDANKLTSRGVREEDLEIVAKIIGSDVDTVWERVMEKKDADILCSWFHGLSHLTRQRFRQLFLNDNTFDHSFYVDAMCDLRVEKIGKEDKS